MLLAVLCLSGCEKVDSQFVFSSETLKLLPDGQQAVKSSLLETFGTPDEPKIPAFFPVDRGGVAGVLAEFDPAAPRQLLLEAPGEVLIPENARLEFLFDPEAALDARLAAAEAGQPDPLAALRHLMAVSFDKTKNQLTLNQDLPELELLEPGTGVVFNANEKLKQAGVLYAHHCLHCHGLTGDGNGPTAPFMNPKPRDYRLGIFKFTSTTPQEKISSADLKHILKEGIPGTYMPAFNMLPEDQLDLLVTYVRYLAIRGEAEKNLNVEVGVDFAQKVLEDELQGVEDAAERQEIVERFQQELKDFLTKDYPEIEAGAMQDLADTWSSADNEDSVLYSSIPRPDPRGLSLANPALTSIENGRLLYLGKDAQCASCHGDTGRGNGYQTFQFQKTRDGSLYEVVGLHDDWGNPLPPRDLTTGIYRGGRRPVDMFRRIYAGIKGTPMPVFGGKGLTDEQIWDIVNYVLVMPEEGK